MVFDLFDQQQKILNLLAPLAGSISIVDGFTLVDLNDGVATTGAQVRFISLQPAGDVGRSSKHEANWSFDVYVDGARASGPQKTAASTLFSAALAALVGWEFEPGRFVRTAPGQESGFDGRIVRISFGFTLPVYLAG